jgi:hypothetical protein
MYLAIPTRMSVIAVTQEKLAWPMDSALGQTSVVYV